MLGGRRYKMIDLRKWKVVWDMDKYVPKKVYDFRTEPLLGTVKEIAETFLKENLGVLKISAPFEDLKFEKVKESLASKTVLFQQYFKGTPIHGAWIAVHIDNQNRVFMVKNDTVPVSQLQERISKSKAGLLPSSKVDAIITKKIKQYGVLDTKIKKQSRIYTLKGNLRNVWKVKFGTKKPAASWILFIDKKTGQIIEERNVLWKADGRGEVFIPNPVVALNCDDLFDQQDKDQAVFEGAYRKVVLKELSGDRLKGPYVDTTLTPKHARASNLNFVFRRDDPRFEEVMAYYHIDTVQRYIQSLGFKDEKAILNRAIKVNAHGEEEDDSYYDYSPDKRNITLGDGGVDDGEDADVIVHEYGHAILDDIIPGFGQTSEGKAIGEGFGDYLAATIFDKYKKGPRKVRFAEWDAKGLKGGPKPCLRVLNRDKHYPESMKGEGHADGEIWSACLWKIREALGKTKSDTVILESLFYLNQYSGFKDAAEAILDAEKNLYGGKKNRSLMKIFKDCGIL